MFTSLLLDLFTLNPWLSLSKLKPSSQKLKPGIRNPQKLLQEAESEVKS